MRSGGHITGWAIYLAAPLCDSLPIEPAILSLSSLLREIVLRIFEWKLNPPTPKFRQHLVAVLCDEIQNARQQPLNLPSALESYPTQAQSPKHASPLGTASAPS
jgi:hypothetical protein